jgi:hypothetical protein
MLMVQHSLVRAAERAKEGLLPLTDENSVLGSLKDNIFSYSLNKQEFLLVAAAQPAYQEALSKQARIEAELDQVIRLYIKHLSPMVCEDVLSKLLLELRKMVYEQIGVTKEHAFVNLCGNYRPRREAVYTVASKLTNIRLLRPWYFDPGIMGEEIAKATLSMWYRCA